jgi:hypothetical protein
VSSCRGGRITCNQLSATGKASVESTNHEFLMIRKMCISQLEHKNLTSPTNEPAVGNQKLSATNDPIANCVWDDIIDLTSQTSMS